jgi:hypothetical protein
VNKDADAKSGANPVMDLVPTPVGTAGLTWYPAHGSARAVAMATPVGTSHPSIRCRAVPDWRVGNRPHIVGA